MFSNSDNTSVLICFFLPARYERQRQLLRGLSLLLSCFRAMAPKAATKSTATVKAAAQKARKLQKAKASPKSKATGVVAVPDAQPITKAENQRLLNVLKYRADPDKNKKGENLAEAQKVLQAGFGRVWQCLMV